MRGPRVLEIFQPGASEATIARQNHDDRKIILYKEMCARAITRTREFFKYFYYLTITMQEMCLNLLL